MIGFYHSNKLCSLGRARRHRGQEAHCPGHAGCSANLRQDENIGDEERGGRACAENLLKGENPLMVSFLTTDADGKASSSIMKETASTVFENLLDPTHLDRSLCRALTNVKLRGDMFPAKTCQVRQRQQKRFAEDLSHRVQSACRQFHQHDCAMVQKSMAGTLECPLQCYGGNHSECPSKSSICRRGNPYCFPFLPRRVKGSLCIPAENRQAIRGILTSRLSHRSLQSTQFETSTQKAEAVNNAFKTTNPKHSSTFSRNAKF